MIKVGDTVRLKAIKPKTRAVVVRVFPSKDYLKGNDWGGWVEVNPKISGFSRWHVDELEKVNVK